MRISRFMVFVLGVGLVSGTGSAQNINTTANFPDANFRAAAESYMDVAAGGIFSAAQAAAKSGTLNCYKRSISSLKGIEFFKTLLALNCSGNFISSMDLSQNLQLVQLDCSNNQLSALNLAANVNLVKINCANNLLTTLNFSSNRPLGYLDCSNNLLTSLDISQNTSLYTLICAHNKLTSLSSLVANLGLSIYDRVDVRYNNLDYDDWYNINLITTARVGAPVYSNGILQTGFAYAPQNGLGLKYPPTLLSLSYPNGGEILSVTSASVCNIAFSATGVITSVSLSYSQDSGATWNYIATGIGVTVPSATHAMQIYPWTVPPTVESARCIVRVMGPTPQAVYDDCDSLFQITHTVVTPDQSRRLSIRRDLVVQPGESFDVPVEIDEAGGILGYRVAVNYNSTYFTYVENSLSTVGTLSSSFISFASPGIEGTQSGRLLITAVGSWPMDSGRGTLIKFKLSAAAATPLNVDYPLNLSPSLTQLNDGQLLTTLSNGNVKVLRYFTWGDLNGDGISGTLDAALLLKYWVFIIDSFPAYPTIKYPAFPPAADVNQDGFAGTLDASLLLQYDGGLILYFPADINHDRLGPEIVPAAKIINRYTGTREEVQLAAAVEKTEANRITPYWKVRFSLDDGKEIQGLRIVIRYDPKQLAVDTKAIHCELNPAYGPVLINSNDPGTLYICGAFGETLPEGPIHLFTIPWYSVQTDSPAAESLYLAIDPQETFFNDKQIPFQIGGGNKIYLRSSTLVPGWELY